MSAPSQGTVVRDRVATVRSMKLLPRSTAASPTRLRTAQSRVLLQIRAVRSIARSPKRASQGGAATGADRPATAWALSPVAGDGGPRKLMPLPLRMVARAQLPSPVAARRRQSAEPYLHAPEPGMAPSWFDEEPSVSRTASAPTGEEGAGTKKRPPALGVVASLTRSTPEPPSPTSPISRRTRLSSGSSPESASSPSSGLATRVASAVSHRIEPFGASSPTARRVKSLLSPTRPRNATPKASARAGPLPKKLGQFAALGPQSPARRRAAAHASVSFTQPRNLPIRVEKRYMPGIGVRNVRMHDNTSVSVVRDGERPPCLLLPTDAQTPKVWRRRSEADQHQQATIERDAIMGASLQRAASRRTSLA
mmetsp:Transcript_27876/g.70238  ORF Transcript_27876/g.70238 Transcript_27876/m.70238 type:complete len:366 (+) Transcript_27876:202-1299(+)